MGAPSPRRDRQHDPDLRWEGRVAQPRGPQARFVGSRCGRVVGREQQRRRLCQPPPYTDEVSGSVVWPPLNTSVVLALHWTPRMKVPLRDLRLAVLARSLSTAL